METVTLPNGVEIFNATPHPLTFNDTGWEAPVVVPSHKVINAYSHNERVGKSKGVSLVKVTFVSRYESEATINQVQEQHPNALIVGSMIAAMAYPEQVVAAKPYLVDSQRKNKLEKISNPNEFTVFLREEKEDN